MSRRDRSLLAGLGDHGVMGEVVSPASCLVLGLGLGVLVASPLLGVGCVWLADRLCDWNERRG